MEFGRVPYDELKEENFILQLPADTFLPGQKAVQRKMHVGLPKWSHPDWKGKLYPAKTHSQETLHFYAGKFNTLELNATHYSHYPDTQYQKWLNKTDPHEFTFCPKFPKAITHSGKIDPITKATETDLFLNGIFTLGKKLGPAFLQVSEMFRFSRKKELLSYLGTLPGDFPMFVETRHHSWYDSEDIMMEFAKELSQLNKGWLITDSPGRRDLLHFKFPVPKLFVRFVCAGNDEMDIFRIAEWKNVLTHLFEIGLEDCWFFLHVLNDEAAIDFAEFVKMELDPIVES